MMPDCTTPEENEVVGRARALLAAYESMADMIRLGAYRKGSDPQLDEAILYYPSLEKFLSQEKNERIEIEESYNQLSTLLNMIAPEDPVLDEAEMSSDTNVYDEEPHQEMN